MKQWIVDSKRRNKIRRKKQIEKYMRLTLQMCVFIGCLILTFLVTTKIVDFVRGTEQEKEVIALRQKDVISDEMKQGGYTNGYEENNVTMMLQSEIDKGSLILVNEWHPIREYSDAQMVEIGECLDGVCQVKSRRIKLQEEALHALREMLIDFNKVVGESDLTVISGYRDFNTQEKLHYNSLLEVKKTDEALVAKPDRSEHHTGLAVDFGLTYEDGTSAEYNGAGIYSWINDHCYQYGFIMRYAADKKEKTGIGYEPWHFRYVGKVHAQIMKELNLCFEEYCELLKNYSYYTKPGQGITQNTLGYSIYYVPCEGEITYIPLPMSKEYVISGNNEDGFIVTVDLTKGKNDK